MFATRNSRNVTLAPLDADEFPATRPSQQGYEFVDALEEVDSVISWVENDGWSHADVSALAAADDLDVDLDEPFSAPPPFAVFEPAPGTQRSPSTIRFKGARFDDFDFDDEDEVPTRVA